jgi:nicotinate-nucleotide--dimethylbenzimidazole phosphoribosyltransferase
MTCTGDLAAEIQQRLDSLTKPPGSLGVIEDVARQLALLQRTTAPRVRTPHALIFAGDHGAADAGISAYPRSVTAQMVANFLAGGAAISVFARTFGLGLTVVDAGVDAALAPHPQLRDEKIAGGTRSYLREPAMTSAERDRAIARGAAQVAALDESGCTVVVLGEMGIGNSASAALLVHRLAPAPLRDCVGPGTGLDPAGVARKLAMLETAAARAPSATEPLDVLAEFGGFEIAMLVGALLEARRRRVLALVDGYIATSAALVAARLDPTVREACVFAHVSAEPGHRHALAALGARGLLDLGLRLGEGSGAALAFPLVLAAERMLNEMATFTTAGVDGATDVAKAGA